MDSVRDEKISDTLSCNSTSRLDLPNSTAEKIEGAMMETSKKKKHDTQPHISFWRRHYPLIFAIVCFVIALLFISFTINIMFGNVSFTFYPILVSVEASFSAIICTVLPILFLGGFLIIVSRNRNNAKNGLSDLVSSSLIIFVIIVIFTYVYFFAWLGDEYTHRDKLQLDNQVYMLTNHVTYPHENGTMQIYQCENFGLFCSKIYETERFFYSYYPAELAFDASTQEISIVINGEVVHTHQLE